MALEVGKAAPAFTLEDGDGNKVSLSDFKGKHVIVYFYPKDDTPGCTKEACGFRDHWKELQKLGAVVLGVSADDAVSHQKFAAKYKLPFPLLSDPKRAVMTKYGAWGEKVLYGKKTTGVIRSTSTARTARCASTGRACRRPKRTRKRCSTHSARRSERKACKLSA
jgi:peroxiredoxin Q/BCP